jgi:hypothetical protein
MHLPRFLKRLARGVARESLAVQFQKIHKLERQDESILTAKLDELLSSRRLLVVFVRFFVLS